jgi:hypothetical protein
MGKFRFRIHIEVARNDFAGASSKAASIADQNPAHHFARSTTLELDRSC